MSICRSYCHLAWRISILKLRELSQKLALTLTAMYELHIVGQKIRLSSPPLKPAEPTEQSAQDKNYTKEGRDRRNDLIRF